MTNPVIELLEELRWYALGKGLKLAIFYHEEQSRLTRFANSAVSLNTSEHLVRLRLIAFEGQRKAEFDLICDPADTASLRGAIDQLADMVALAQPLSYQPTFPVYPQRISDIRAYDEGLAALTSEDRLAFFNEVAQGLESADVRLSGIFSSGVTTTAQISTANENSQFFKVSDAKISVVLSSEKDKWEVNAEQSAQKKSDLNAPALRADLEFLLRCYQQGTPLSLPLGKYRVVFGPAASAEVLEIMAGWGGSGGAMKRGFSFLRPEDVGQRVLSPLLTLVDDPNLPELYGQPADEFGVPRGRFPLYEKGVFQGFLWEQDDADEFGEQPTGHTLPSMSLAVAPGSMPCANLEQLAALPRTEDVLYIPYIHYINIVNPSKGLITGSSRFGALLLRADGTIAIPYNVRLTQSFSDFFGERVAWLSRETVVYNTSGTYGRRIPTALRVPRFLCVDGIEVSHSNTSY